MREYEYIIERLVCEHFKSPKLAKLCKEHDGLLMDEFGRPVVLFNGKNNIPESEITDEMLDDEIQYSTYNDDDNAIHFHDGTFVEFDMDKHVKDIARIRDVELYDKRKKPRGQKHDTGYHKKDEVLPMSTKIKVQKNKYDEYDDGDNGGKWYQW